jgi:hypothetical protein
VRLHLARVQYITNNLKGKLLWLTFVVVLY